ncbi:PREDICTED: RNA polymerase II-associated protein 1 [Acromyrmex echinatior]|uniref:RNA polymerase II-associated protein 1 n=1 Tax=Acromyrmex echinatior TaxID=103372 RepID=F4WLI3_ACREC|nr:PREDICTED: RNA polymerase II-associated protein 1 [Acromyrmex echinatior]EGI64919.1 RNA polymerase II-associated protein 1 [Acromyrmex echinatior]
MADEVELKRPRANDDEEELLRQQEEFLKAKQPPAVKVTNLRNSTNASGASRSRFSSLRQSKVKQDVVSTSQGSGEMINPVMKDKIQDTKGKLQDMVQNIPAISSNIILGNIMERKFNIKEYEFNDNCVSTAVELPEIYGSNDMSLMNKNDSKQSLFSQKFLSGKLKSVRDNCVKIHTDESSHCNKEENIMTKYNLFQIYKENSLKLAQMSEAEILKEKRKLEETLDPKIIQFLRNKKNKSIEKSIKQNRQLDASVVNKTAVVTEVSNDKKVKLSSNDNEEMDCETDVTSTSSAKETTMDTEISSNKKIKLSSDNVDTKMDCEDGTLSIPDSSKEIFKESKQKGWLHMNTPEPEKLKWMEDLPEKEKDETLPDKEYNARFDFNGLLLPYKDESLTVNKGLYHHGEEPERPGYSFQELLQLSRSSNQQQRCTALTTLANIMEKTRRGWYDKALHPAPLTALSQKNILLLLRFSLDDSSVVVVTAALQALRAFLVSEADEVCLDRLYGFEGYIEPTLTPQLEDNDTSSLKDHELAQLDAVVVLLRSDFLLRIRYILSAMHPPPVGVMCALEILIRLARHSHITALNISSTPYLLDIIIQNFIPLSTDRLAMQDEINNVYGIPVVTAIKLCRVLVTYGKKPIAQKLDNFKIIQAILTYISSETGKDHINLSIESLRLWRILLHYKVGLDSVTGAQLTLISQLQLLLSNHDIQNTSELACEHAAALIAIASHEKMFKPNISTLLMKWSTQFSSVSNPTWGVMKLIAQSLSAVDEISAFKSTWLSNQHVFLSLRSSSNLLSDNNAATDREPSCLPNLDVLTENGELQPIVSVNSCIPFLATIFNTLYNNSRVAEIRLILEHPSFLKYIEDLEKTEWSLERSWFSRTELYLLTTVVRAVFLLGDTINNRTAQIVWKITIKLISTLPADATDHVRKLLQIALSNEKVNLEIITNELAKLDLTSTVDQIKTGLRSDATSLYERYIAANGDWNQAAMPKDWLFLPLVHIYTKSKNDIKLQSGDKDSILTVLSLALVLPDLMEKLSPTLRFSRLILVYLCDTVYLESDVAMLLLNVLSNLLRRYHARLNFRTELPGLSSFTDLFTALCEHFYSNSYGDDGFAMILLVPVAQRHDPHYRKLLWSEHAAALRYLKLLPEKLVLPLKEYLYPEEEDTSLIESYITALVRDVVKKSWCPIPFMIAVHHSAMYLKRTNGLAMRMRMQVEKLRNRDIADALLHYLPPQL